MAKQARGASMDDVRTEGEGLVEMQTSGWQYVCKYVCSCVLGEYYESTHGNL